MKLKLISSIALTLLFTSGSRGDAAGQDITDQSGNMFMEETTPTPPPSAVPKQNRVGIDLSNVGVPIDPHGHIVPLIDKNAPNGVRQNFSNLEVYSEPAWNFLPAPIYNAYGSPYNFAPNIPIGMPYGMPFGTPYYPSGNNIGFSLGRNFHLNIGSPGNYGWGNPYGWSNPYGWQNPYGGGIGNMFGMSNPFGFGGLGGINLNPITNPVPIGANFSAPYGAPFGYPTMPYSYPGGFFAPSPFPIYNSPLLGSSLFSAQSSGLGLNLFVPSTVEWQSKSTFTPLTPNLDGPP